MIGKVAEAIGAKPKPALPCGLANSN